VQAFVMTAMQAECGVIAAIAIAFNTLWLCGQLSNLQSEI
jgi:hypothetical protein